ncbi:hypothetical protein [Histidinibacterium aquaticum]|uniref:DUF2029 domain-containing protein n=1 Tax=Histidinibacterium aquaticum TaxID=2613962 RepID=A0A5J5GAD8_9RHOB|nr:hypothetical protein [Histidinibacterium aquaticum]KAA9005085.1 hypothetical protein F3S47_18830 [Histidinibacterium aquaticum]
MTVGRVFPETTRKTERGLLAALLALGVVWNLLLLYRQWPEVFWDLGVYEAAVTAFNQGQSAYQSFEGLYFVYSPYVLFAFASLGTWLPAAFLLLYLAATLLFLRSGIGLPLFLAAIASSVLTVSSIFMTSVGSGNVTIFLHFLAITASFAVFQAPASRARAATFFVTVCLISLIKPYFLSYLVFGVLAERSRRRVAASLLCALSWAVLFGAQALSHPDLFGEFLASLRLQALGSGGGAGQDVGLAPYSVFGEFVGRYPALVLHVLFVAGLATLLFGVWRFSGMAPDPKESRTLLFLTALILVTLLNPRMKVYDYWIVGAASALVFYLLLKRAEWLEQLTWFGLLCAMTLAVFAMWLAGFPYLKYVRVYLLPLLAFTVFLRFALGPIPGRTEAASGLRAAARSGPR